MIEEANLQSRKHQSFETNLADIDEDDTNAGELKLVEGADMLVGELFLLLPALALLTGDSCWARLFDD